MHSLRNPEDFVILILYSLFQHVICNSLIKLNYSRSLLMADISRCYDGIRENTLKGIMAKSIEVKNAFDDDTALLNEQIEDDMNVAESASRALGAICAVTEELFRKTDPEPHGDESKPEEEMEKLREEYASFYNGEGLEGDPYIIMDRDVYCVIEANW